MKIKDIPGTIKDTTHINSLWVARNKEGDLCLFSKKPHKGYTDKPFRELWCCSTIIPFCGYSVMGNTGLACVLDLDDSMFPEVTWETGPKELILKEEK